MTAPDLAEKKAPESRFSVSIWGSLAFVSFGMGTLASPAIGMKAYNIVFGILAGLIFGWLCKMFLTWFLARGNSQLKEKWGPKVIKAAVEKSFVFLVPFAVMSLLAVYFMGWNFVPVFVSAGLMTAGALSAMEIGRLKGKKEIKTTIVASVVAWAFSTLWLISTGFLVKVPSYAEGAVNILKLLTGVKAG